jgi:hypothetical protein
MNYGSSNSGESVPPTFIKSKTNCFPICLMKGPMLNPLHTEDFDVSDSALA